MTSWKDKCRSNIICKVASTISIMQWFIVTSVSSRFMSLWTDRNDFNYKRSISVYQGHALQSHMASIKHIVCCFACLQSCSQLITFIVSQLDSIFQTECKHIAAMFCRQLSCQNFITHNSRGITTFKCCWSDANVIKKLQHSHTN